MLPTKHQEKEIGTASYNCLAFSLFDRKLQVNRPPIWLRNRVLAKKYSSNWSVSVRLSDFKHILFYLLLKIKLQARQSVVSNVTR